MKAPGSPTQPQQRRRSSQPEPLNLGNLSHTSIERLRQLWSLHMGRSPPPNQRRVLVRELAWRTQARDGGGFDHRTQRLLSAAMRDAARACADRRKLASVAEAADCATVSRAPGLPSAALRVPQSVPVAPAPRRRVKAGKAPDFAPGTRLVRSWRNQRHEVFVTGTGQYRYGEKVFASLSEVARAITGAHWSGPRFFGITTRTGKPRRSEARDG